jgi:DNA-binding IclR family transcriptional regulator
MTAISSGIQVIDRATVLLDILAQHPRSSLKLIAAESGLHPSTAFRILNALASHGMVSRDAQGHYQLGARLLGWADRVRSRLDLRSEARPEMEWLRDQVGETVNLTVREGDEVIYLERVTARHAVRVEQVIGSHAPLHVTAVGKLMLGELGEQAICDYAARTGLPRFTTKTVTELPALQQEIRQAVADGYAYDDEEAETGVGCIGVLVRDSSGMVVAGLSISAPIERWQQDWVTLVGEAGRRISRRLGYDPGLK